MSLCVHKKLNCSPCRPSLSRSNYVGSYLYCILLCPHTTELNTLEPYWEEAELPKPFQLAPLCLLQCFLLQSPIQELLLLCRSKQEQLVEIQLHVSPQGKHLQSWRIQASSEYPCMCLNRMEFYIWRLQGFLWLPGSVKLSVKGGIHATWGNSPKHVIESCARRNNRLYRDLLESQS